PVAWQAFPRCAPARRATREPSPKALRRAQASPEGETEKRGRPAGCAVPPAARCPPDFLRHGGGHSPPALSLLRRRGEARGRERRRHALRYGMNQRAEPRVESGEDMAKVCQSVAERSSKI